MKTLTVLTFNTANDFVPPESLSQFLGDSGADIIGLQELSPRNAAALSENLQEIYPYRVLHGKFFDGKGLLSRYPISSHNLFTAVTPRPHLEAELEVEGQTVMAYVVHLPAPNYRRMEAASPHCVPELNVLLERVKPAPTLFLGDFNTVEQSAVYRMMLATGFKDTFDEVGVGRGRTFPTRFQYVYIPLRPMVRLDYIWASHHFTPMSSYVGSGHGSDHLPVISKVALQHQP